MSENLLEQIPGIIAAGRQDAERSLEAGRRLALETREWVLPAKDSALLNWIRADKRRRQRNDAAEVQPNRLVHGDELRVMSVLLAGEAATPSLRGKIDLIYMDLSFVDGKDFEAGMVSCLRMLVPRLILAGELLSDRGSMCLRVERRMKLIAKRMIDELFDCLHSAAGKMTEKAFVNPASASGSAATCRDPFIIVRKRKAKRLRRNGGAGFSPALDFDEAFPIQEKTGISIQEFSFAAPGNLTDESGDPEKDRTCSRPSGVRINPEQPKRCGCASEESSPPLEAIILASTGPDSMVADFFGRSGNTACVAERLGRRWIISDIDRSACADMRSRLIDQNAEPFLYQAVDTAMEKSTEKAATASSGDACRTGDLSQIVLLLFGAQPLESEHDPDRHLGQFFHAGGKTLVRVESPGTSTGQASLTQAIAQRDSLLGGWDRVVVLAWELEPSIDAIIEQLKDSRLEVLLISAELIEMLSKSGETDGLRKTACFAETQT